MAYFQKGVVIDAKVLFGPKVFTYARRSFGAGQSFGSLDRIGIAPDHSVLLLRIDTLTIADWSHNGKCHIWRDGDPRAPQLWPNPPKQLYTKDELRTASQNEGVAHHGSENGRWQAKIADYIWRHTGITIGPSEYMPPRERR
jgi:hypothetical protein